MKNKLIYLIVVLALLCTGCSWNKSVPQNTATPAPSEETHPKVDAKGLVEQENVLLGFTMKYDPNIFKYTEYDEGPFVASFTAQRGMTGNIYLMVSAYDQSIESAINNIKMQSFVQTSTTEEAIIGQDNIPVTKLHFYDKTVSDVISTYYIWEREVAGKNQTYIIEVFDIMNQDGVGRRQAEFKEMIDSFTYMEVRK